MTTMLWGDHILPAGLTSARPAATAVAVGALYASTDDGVIYRNNGTTWDTYASTGATTLAGLSDVDTTTTAPTDGQALKWNATDSKWEPADEAAAGATALDDLSDVDTTTTAPTSGDVLEFDGTEWTPAAPVSGGVAALNDLTDVDTATTAPTDGQALVWNATASLWEPATVAGGTGTVDTVAEGTGINVDATDPANPIVAVDETVIAPLASPALTGNPTAPTPTAGDNDTSIATTAFVTNAVAKQPEALTFALGDETTAITTGTKVTWRIPFAFTITEIRASLTTASSSGNPAFDVKKNGATVFSTTLTIDATEKTSKTAATAAVLSTTALADDDELTFSVTTAGTGAAGAKITILGTRA